MTKHKREIGAIEYAALKAGIRKDILDERIRRDALIAKPIKTPIDQAELRRELMNQFSKTLAYLAK